MERRNRAIESRYNELSLRGRIGQGGGSEILTKLFIEMLANRFQNFYAITDHVHYLQYDIRLQIRIFES